MKIITLFLICLPFLHPEILSAQSPELIATEISARKLLLNPALVSPAGSNFKVSHYRCEWAINPAVRYISGRVRCDFSVSADTASLLFFDFSSQLTVDSVVHRGAKINSGFSSSNLFWIKTSFPMNQGNQDSVSIYYKGVPANSGFGSFNKQTHAGQPIIWTMSCPYAASDWWPCVQSHRQKADSIDMIIRVPATCRAAGNGKLLAEIQTDSSRIFYWKHRHPIASYLVATAVTNYASFSTRMHLPSMAAGDSMPVLNFVYPEALSSASFNLPKVMPILAYYDSLVAPYPFRDEKYGHAQFGWGGGMEHQTMSFMTNFSVSLQAHELAHQWFGNHITCRSWTDVWLNEGWATYMAALAEQKMGTASFQSWLNSTQGAVKASSGGSVWVNDTSDINRIFDSRLTYKKGALLLHMLRWELGDSAFWAGVRHYQSDPALVYGFATTEQFFQHMEQASGRNLSRFKQDWFYGQGYPSCQLKLSAEGSGIYRLRIGQTSSHPSVPFFHLKIPVRIAGSGQDTTMVFSPDSSGQEFLISLPFVPGSMVFDPSKWLLAKSTVQIVTSIPPEDKSRALPKIAPNPFGDSLEISFEKFPAAVRIFNLQGKEVLRQFLASGGSGRIDTRKLIAGNYLLLWESAGRSGALKVIKSGK
jgi:aminopeptidase N